MITGYPKFKQYTEAQMPSATSVPNGTEVFNSTYQVKMRSDGTSWEWLGAGRSTWANKPSVAPSGQIICVTDIGENGSLWRGNGTTWKRLHQIRFYDLSASVALTGTTTETTLVTLTIPAGLIGANGKVKFYPLFSMTNNANSKTVKVKLGDQMCYIFSLVSTTTNAPLVVIRNFNSESLQKTLTNNSVGMGSTGTAYSATTANTATAVDLVITGQLASAGDTLTLESLFVEIV